MQATEIRNYLEAQGASLVGFADLSPLDEPSRLGFPRAVSFCVPLDARVIAGIQDGPTEEYCREYDRANAALAQIGREVAASLTTSGWRADARPGTADFDPVACRARFPHKTAATLAGLGWVGKCDLLVTRQFGSAARWGTILTDVPLPTGTPQVQSRCGSCTACVDACPGKALSGKTWRPGITREELVDVQGCLRTMTEVSRERGNHRDVCGRCIAACPWTVRYLERQGILPVKGGAGRKPQDELP